MLFHRVIPIVRARFSPIASKEFVKQIERINAFRNTYVAHQELPLEDVEQARAALKEWERAYTTFGRRIISETS